jgi:hypothetical protein
MARGRSWSELALSDTRILIVLAVLRLSALFLHKGQSGWHRDELDTLNAAHHLAWGLVSYPALAPFLARVALTLFGPSLAATRNNGLSWFCRRPSWGTNQQVMTTHSVLSQ